MPQTGAEHRFYVGVESGSLPATLDLLDPGTAAGKKPRLMGIDDLIDKNGDPSASGTQTAEVLRSGGHYRLADLIRDVNVGGTNNEIDTTVREDARQGFSTSVIATSSATFSVQMRYEKTEGLTINPAQHGAYVVLMSAFQTKSEIWAIDLDRLITEDGAQGLSGNWSVGFSNPKPVAGLVVVDFTLTLAGKGQLIYFDSSAAKFKAFQDP